MLHQRENIRFNCTACGKCCYGDKHAYIRLNHKDVKNIVQHLALTQSYFSRKYLVRLVDKGYGIRIKESGACALLGKDGRCRVYPVRPMQCRTYPYWPEILINKTSWLGEKKRCEGIDQGDEIATAYIDKQLKLSIEAETEEY